MKCFRKVVEFASRIFSCVIGFYCGLAMLAIGLNIATILMGSTIGTIFLAMLLLAGFAISRISK